MTDPVKIEGLKEFQQALREVDRDLPKELRKANKGAAEFVRDESKQKAQSLDKLAAKSAVAISSQAEQRRARVVLDGTKYPWALGANFGALHNIPRHTSRGTVLGWNQFVDRVKPDRFLFATIQTKNSELVDFYEQAVAALLEKLADDGVNVGSLTVRR